MRVTDVRLRYTGAWLLLAIGMWFSMVAHAGPGVWTSGGPYGGYVTALAINPSTPATLYAGTASGVFKSTDSGGTWAAANKGLTNLNISALAINPTTPTTLYAGTYDGVFKSTDSGGTWAAANTGLTNLNVYALAINPTTPATLYAGTWGGVFKSTDSGGTWAAANTGLTNPYVYALAIDPTTPATLYAGTSQYGSYFPTYGEVFKSTDSGGTWVAANTGLTQLTVPALAINPTTPATLYAGTRDGVFKSTDSGGTWAAANKRLPKLSVDALALDPTGETTLYAGLSYGSVWQSTPATGGPVCTIACSASGPSSGQTGQSLSFTSSATPSNCSGSVSYAWDFGDGQTSGSQNPSHVYSSAGTYTWTLTASVGSTQCQKTGTMTISAPSVCTFSCSASAPSTGQTGQSLSFASSATPSNCSGSVSYFWNFGDGQTSGSQNPSHAYSSPGTYTWTLTAYVGSTQCQKTGTISIAVAGSCNEDSLTMCLISGWYRVTSYWRNQYAGGALSNLNKTRLTDTTGAFWIADANTYEYMIRFNTVTDNGRAWISIPMFTDVEFYVAVTDTVNGQYKEYHSPAYNRTLIYDPLTFVFP